jgi:hypothetical protein
MDYRLDDPALANVAGLTRYTLFGQRIGTGSTPVGKNTELFKPVGDMRDPDIAYNPDANEYMAVYRDDQDGTTAGYNQIYMQRVYPNGLPAGGWPAGHQSRIRVWTQPGNQSMPKIAYNAVAKRYLVTWQQSVGTSGDTDIYARFMNSNGSGGTGVLLATAANQQLQPQVEASTTDDRFFVVWRDSRAGVNLHDVYGRFLQGTTNATVGSELHFTDTASYPTANNILKLNVIASYNSDDDNFLVSWWDNAQGTMARFAKLTGSTASLLGTSTLGIGGSGGPGGFHSIGLAYRPAGPAGDGRFLLTDQEQYSGKIKGKLLDRSGALVSNVALQSTTTGMQVESNVAYNSVDDEFLVTWTDHRSFATAPSDIVNIMGRTVAAATGAVGAEIEIATPNTGAAYNQYASTPVYNPQANEYFAVWMDYRLDDPALANVAGLTRYTLFGQRIH